MRRVRATCYRYYLGENYFYIPTQQLDLEDTDRLCWVRDRELFSLQALDAAFAAGDLSLADVRMGNTYPKRHREENGIFVEVESFVGKALFQELKANPEALPSVSKNDFEGLFAELFVRRGFEVDLFRKSKDGGIEFIAIKNEDIDPLISAVQCKQPDERPRKKRRSLGRPTVQQIYGAAKACDLSAAMEISGST